MPLPRDTPFNLARRAAPLASERRVFDVLRSSGIPVRLELALPGPLRENAELI